MDGSLSCAANLESAQPKFANRAKVQALSNLYRCAIPLTVSMLSSWTTTATETITINSWRAIVDGFIVWWFYPPTVYVNRLCPFKHHLQCQPIWTPWAVSLEGVTHWKQINTFGGPSQKNPQSFYQNHPETLNPHDHDPPISTNSTPSTLRKSAGTPYCISSASKKRLPVDICRFLQKKPIQKTHKKSHRFSVIFSSKIHGIQGTEYWLSLYSEGRNPRSGRSVYAAVEGAEMAVYRDGELCKERSERGSDLMGIS